ncbi:MAG: ADP-ribose pyrophosphatase [Bdellovibrio sp. CG10_big_fil_rev_8_21_14_0_10_47_8]|nr:MAG: ADP-ribose pyrophosphatase [Bdellovibrio sp. CG10_big_fil_rev_8_21_14_0_10_47_8]
MKKLLEKSLSSEVVFDGLFLKIWRDEVELSTGATTFREYVKHPGAALVVPLLENGNLLMIYQYRHSVGQTFLEFPAGKCDPGEKAEQTALRELREEVGLETTNIRHLTHIHPVIGYSNERIDLFLAKDFKQVPDHRDADELLELIEVSPQDLKEKIWAHEVTDVKTQIAAFWLFRELGI